ncbi:hypothetical protein GCM10023092_02830 [Rurimicrobium arvi]|uniref:Ig-like domain-containing protein n=2 Tax=Rurimicrobium arvi TaxID=2049916 RepID=A0ABP8MI33_9BACT
MLSAQTISTIAGSSSSGYAGDGGAATAASLNLPAGMATDAAGNIYFADYLNNVIRRVDATTGIITTVAGSGSAGFSGDGAAATSAKMYQVTGVTVDQSTGDLYISDRGNHRIRKVTASTGVISTIAGTGTASHTGDGGAATSATLYLPTDVRLDNTNTVLYIACLDNTVRKINLSTGIITNVAGTSFSSGSSGDGGAATAALLGTPYIGIDYSNNLYISDIGANVIRKIDASTGIISKIAGTGTGAHSGDGGAATAASIYAPVGISFDASGNLYFSENQGNTIRKIDASGIITTIAGTGTMGFSGDGGAPTSAQINYPWGTALQNGKLVFSDGNNDRLRAFDVCRSVIFVDSSVAVSGTGYSWSSPFKTLSQALDTANAGSCPVQIWVKKGTYYPMAGTAVASSRDSSFRIYRNYIKVYGGFAGTETSLSARSVSANPTILSGDIGVSGDSSDNCYHVIALMSTASFTLDTNTVLDGFTVQSGNCNGSTSFSSHGALCQQFDGAGIYITANGTGANASPLIANCTSKLHAGNNGGGIYCGAYNSSLCYAVIRNSTFTNNKTSNVGGGVCTYSNGGTSSPSFYNCTISGNIATSKGGGAYSDGGSPLYRSCTFSSNRITATGGTDYGGAYCGFGASSNPDFEVCTFSSNSSTSYGGAVIGYGTQSITIDSCTFTSNSSAYGGGASIFPSTTANISNTTFTSNTGSTGAGIELYYSATANVDNCVFQNGSVSAYGSALRTNSTSTFNVTRSRFLNGTGGAVGAVDNGSGTCNFTNCVFSGNSTSQVGGVINNNSGNATFTQCVLTGNSTTTTTNSGGGAIHVTTGTVTLNNSTLYNNTTASTAIPNGNAVAVDASGTAIFNNTIVWGTAAQQIGGTGTTTYNNSLAKGLSLTAPSLSSNPQFINPSDPDGTDNTWGTSDDGLHLTPCSPCLNTGDNTLVPGTLTADYASATRIQNTTVDMGAYEHAFAAQGIPDVTITAGANPICAGANVTFSYTAVWPGASPSFAWYKNGTLVSSAASYSSTGISNNDTVWVIMTNNDCGLSDTSNRIVMKTNGGRIYVDSAVAVSGTGSSWSSPFKTLTEALTLANNTPSTCATEIWVRKGTYYPGTVRDSSFRITRNNIKVYGGFAGTETALSARSVSGNPTLLSADIGTAGDSTDNNYHVMTIIGSSSQQIDTNTVVDGFTICYGNGRFSGSFTYNGTTFNRQDGSGILIYGGGSGNMCSPLIANCTITRNAANFGGGIYAAGFTSGSSGPVLRNNQFISNTAANNGGGLFTNAQVSGSSTATIVSCTFSGNKASNGGGIYFQGSGGTLSSSVSGSTFQNNSASAAGGAVQNNGNSTITYSNNVFSSNTAPSGAALYNSSSATITYTSCRMSSNTATTNGGGAYTSSGTANYSLCVFNSNTASDATSGEGGAMFINGGTSTLTNCVLAANSAAGTGGDGGGAIKVAAGTVNLQSSTLAGNSSASTVKTDANTVSTLSGSTTNILNTIIWGSAAAHVNTAGTVNFTNALVKGATLTAPSLSANPKFTNEAVPAGADGIWLTTDDGLNLLPCSPAINVASAAAPSTDILNRARVSLPDMGAYEEQGAPLPVAPTVTSPVTYCQGATAIALTATKTSSTDTLKWYDASMTLLSGAPTPSTATAGTITYYVSQTNVSGCEGAKATINVVVNPKPAAPTVTTPVTYCAGTTATALTATVSGAGDTLKWYNSSATLLSGAPTPSTATAGTFTWSVSEKNGFGCESNKTTITVNVNPTPVAPTATTPVVYCQGATASALSAVLSAGSDTLKWYDASSAPLSAAPTPSTATAGTYTWYVSQKTSLGCEGPKRTITVTVNPTPAIPVATTPITYCQNAVASVLTATASGTGDTLKWYDSSPALLGGAPTPSTATSGTFTWSVSEKNSFGCESAKKTITVVVNPTPTAPVAVTPVIYCQDDVAVALSATKASATDTLKWYNSSSVALGTTAPTPVTTTAGTYTWLVSDKTSLGCESPKTTITVTVNPKPLAPTVVTPINLCVGIAASPLTATGTNLKWYVTATGGSAAPSVTPPTGTTGTLTYYVSQTNSFGCEGPRASLTVNVRPSPVVTIAARSMPAMVFCVGDSMVLQATSATAISYQWQKGSTPLPGATRDTFTVSATATYGVIVKDMYGCADTESVYVMENPLPKPALSPTEVLFCPGTTVMLYASPKTSGYRYDWYKDNVLMGLDTATYNVPVGLPGVYQVTIKDIYTCVTKTNLSYVSTYPAMTKPEIVQTGISLKTKIAYSAYQWYRNYKAIPGANTRTYNMSFDGIYYVVVQDENGCEGVSDTIQSNVLKVDEQSLSSIRLYPNPTQNSVHIDATAKVNVLVSDMAGRQVLQLKEVNEVDLSSFTDGMYLFRISDKEGRLLLIEKVNKVSGQ